MSTFARYESQNSMARYVITVDFYLHTGTLEPFLKLIKENAHKSLTDEPGCDTSMS